MATEDEYRAVYGGDYPAGLGAGARLGDGGCNAISRDDGGLVGFWSSWENASVALNRLQELGGRYEYRLEESHQWVTGPEHNTICVVCSIPREAPESTVTAPGMEWRPQVLDE
ncbi:MAG: hypothetical protein ACXVYB_09285 [Arthrobacter sp.]